MKRILYNDYEDLYGQDFVEGWFVAVESAGEEDHGRAREEVQAGLQVPQDQPGHQPGHQD